MFKKLILLAITLLSFGVVSADTATTGTIAYIHAAGDQIRLVKPNGTQDRAIWNNPTPDDTSIFDLDWHPDGTRLAMSSSHEISCSLYNRDIFTINSSGGGLKRVTNNPACAALASYPKGSVEITFRNSSLYPIESGVLIAYVQGALGAIDTAIGIEGSSVTVLIPNVADMGDVLQPIIAKRGFDNWLDPVGVDVIAGQTVRKTITLDSNNDFNYVTSQLSWSGDGRQIGYSFGEFEFLEAISADSTVGEVGTMMQANGNNVTGTLLDWSPTNRYVAYTVKDGIYVLDTTNPSAAPVKHVSYDLFANYFMGVDWLPDESGFVFAFTQGDDYFFDDRTAANLYHYDIGSEQLTQLTQHEGDGSFAFDPKVSPDGTELVYTFQPSGTQMTHLYRMPLAGGSATLVVENGYGAVWTAAEISNTPTAVHVRSLSIASANGELLASILLLIILTCGAKFNFRSCR